MTCIIEYAKKGVVWIGGDSAGVGGYSLQIRSDEKVFKKDKMIFGFTSSFRMGQIIRYCLSIPEQYQSKDDYEYLCSDFMDSLIKCFTDKGYLKKKNEVKIGGVFLLGYRGDLYTIYDDFQVSKVVKDYNAVGCGEDLATEETNWSPESRINKALAAASEHSAGVAPPFNIVKLENNMSKTPNPPPPEGVVEPSPSPPRKPQGFNESHDKDCDCRICMMARDGCPVRGSFRDKAVEK